MSKQAPYFSFHGLPFQTPGDDIEQAMNMQIAMERLRAFVCDQGGNEEDAAAALAFLQNRTPKLSEFCKQMRLAFLLDDFEDADRKKRLIIRAYNGIVDRLNGTPVRWDG